MEFICKKTYQAHDPDQWTGTDVGKFDQHGFSPERRFSFIKDNGQVISVPSKESVLYRSYWTTIKVNKTLLNETVKEIGIEKLIPYKMLERSYDVEKFKRAFEDVKNKNYEPLLIDKNNVIIDGHHRYDCLKLLDKKTANVIVGEDTWEKVIEFNNLEKGSNEAIRCMPLQCWNTIDEAVKGLSYSMLFERRGENNQSMVMSLGAGLKLHEDIVGMVKNINYKLLDQNTLEEALTYENKDKWLEFNKRVTDKTDPIDHGYINFSPFAFLLNSSDKK